MWRDEIRGGTNTTGRDQPALKKIITSGRCTVVDLPEATQGFFTTALALRALVDRRVFDDVGFVHFTGSAHDTTLLMPIANVDGLHTSASLVSLILLLAVASGIFLIFRSRAPVCCRTSLV